LLLLLLEKDGLRETSLLLHGEYELVGKREVSSKLCTQATATTHVELGEEESEERRRNGESRAEDDSEVANVHLGYVGVLSDNAEIYWEGGEGQWLRDKSDGSATYEQSCREDQSQLEHMIGRECTTHKKRNKVYSSIGS